MMPQLDHALCHRQLKSVCAAARGDLYKRSYTQLHKRQLLNLTLAIHCCLEHKKGMLVWVLKTQLAALLQ